MPAEHAPHDRYPEVLRDLADKLAVRLREHGLSPEDAQLVGVEVAEWVREKWGGQRIYIKSAARLPRKGSQHK